MKMNQHSLVCIIGAGALGSHLVQFLRNEKAAIKIIDFDVVEQKNVLSQFHGKPGVGKKKVAALQQTMDFLFKRPLSVINNKLVAENIDVLSIVSIMELLGSSCRITCESTTCLAFTGHSLQVVPSVESCGMTRS
jgi:tRNA A37 threonylcarbamoyladenosine dehydratase